MKDFATIAKEIGELLNEKNEAYGNAFEEAGKVLRILYPKGVEPSQYPDLLAIVRVIDKLFRIATDKDAFGEDPWRDIGGYSILRLWTEQDSKVN